MALTKPSRSIRRYKLITPRDRKLGGFAIVSALFIIVALAALGAFIAVVSGGQQIGSTYDLNGARAYYAARAGAEWGAANALGNNACVAATNFPLNTVNNMAITVNCNVTATGDAVEAGLQTIWTITATACNQPLAGACPGNAGGGNYVERRVQIVVE